MTAESRRLKKADQNQWRLWGPYLSERQWGTVREDYSADGEAWDYFLREQAPSRAYRWGEDGIAGISDHRQTLCFALSLWNRKDPLLKERLFGLTSKEGNHGEDVKEYYFYLDNLPTHAYMRYLYKYPQESFPYEQLLKENQRRSRHDFEYELLDTGIFDHDRYFDVFIEYAKADPTDISIQITVINHGPDEAKLDLLPTLWLRNTWSWGLEEGEKPKLFLDRQAIQVESHLGTYWLYYQEAKEVLFTENNTNREKLFGVPNETPYVKDGIQDAIVHGMKTAVNPQQEGTKAAIHYPLIIPSKQSATVILRLCHQKQRHALRGAENVIQKRKKEADAFYQKQLPKNLPEDVKRIYRQACAGLLWNKQLYHYNVGKWLHGDPVGPPPPKQHQLKRNHKWWHFDAFDIMSMPDKWEYPWFAAWDLAFHAVAFASIDPQFAKNQLLLLTKEYYMRADGQLPAYEWNFSDVNPPVHAWAAFTVYQIEAEKYGRKDRNFLERIFQKLLLNFTWWVSRKDEGDRNIFEGGFLGLDNIGVFDRSKGSPIGGVLEQADGTGWMGMYCLNLFQIALELSNENSNYEEMAIKFLEHFIDIADAINDICGETHGLWDETKGFYYGLLSLPNGSTLQMDYETLAGLVPLFAVLNINPIQNPKLKRLRQSFDWILKKWSKRIHDVIDMSQFETKKTILMSLASKDKLKRILERVLDETQFLSPFGVRSVSKKLADHPFVLTLGGQQFRLDYEPAESTTPLFGGNSNWRGPIWFPLNYLLIQSLEQFHRFLGEEFKVEYPQGSGQLLTLKEISKELGSRLLAIFLQNPEGQRPVYGGIKKFQTDPAWKDYLLFHEYFHGDNGAGLGASNQTGWTALIIRLIENL